MSAEPRAKSARTWLMCLRSGDWVYARRAGLRYYDALARVSRRPDGKECYWELLGDNARYNGTERTAHEARAAAVTLLKMIKGGWHE